jgi:hypothetical protein
MRFTGEPAYFKHIQEAGKRLMEGCGTNAKDYRWAIFHQPNTKFPQRAAAQLGFSKEQIEPGLLVSVIGNTYAGAAMIGLTSTLDMAEPGDRILMVSFGSGGPMHLTSWSPTNSPRSNRQTEDYIARRTEIDSHLCALSRKTGNEVTSPTRASSCCSQERPHDICNRCRYRPNPGRRALGDRTSRPCRRRHSGSHPGLGGFAAAGALRRQHAGAYYVEPGASRIRTRITPTLRTEAVTVEAGGVRVALPPSGFISPLPAEWSMWRWSWA